MDRIEDIAREARAAGLSPWLAIKENAARHVIGELARTPGAAVLQGGAALRFVYGSPRLSVDVDFAGLGSGSHLAAKGPDLAARLARELGLPVTWTVKVAGRMTRGKLTMSTSSGHALALPVEAFEVPVHRPFASSHGPVEAPEEIIADKIAATIDRVAQRGTAKLTDFFDIWFLRAERVPLPNAELVSAKLRDYGLTPARAPTMAYLDGLQPEELARVLQRVLAPAELAAIDPASVIDAVREAIGVLDGVA